MYNLRYFVDMLLQPYPIFEEEIRRKTKLLGVFQLSFAFGIFVIFIFVNYFVDMPGSYLYWSISSAFFASMAGFLITKTSFYHISAYIFTIGNLLSNIFSLYLLGNYYPNINPISAIYYMTIPLFCSFYTVPPKYFKWITLITLSTILASGTIFLNYMYRSFFSALVYTIICSFILFIVNYFIYRDQNLIVYTRSNNELTSLKNMTAEMTAGIAHELKNPITICMEYFKMLKMEIPENSEVVKGYLNKIQKNLDRTIQIISSVKEVHRYKMAETPDKFTANSLLADIESIVYYQSQAQHISIKINYLKNDINVTQYKTPLLHSLLNLIFNSIEAITFCETKWIQLDTEVSEKLLRFSVTDCGKGIPEEIQTEMFKPFYTTKKEGNGLGLNLSKKFIENMKGRLYYDPQSSHTRFIIEVPQNFS